MGKQEFYTQLFTYLIQFQKEGKQISARQVMEQMLKGTNISISYDSEMASLLISFIENQILDGNEQMILMMIQNLQNEKLILKKSVEKVMENLQKVVFFRNLANIYTIEQDDLKFLVQCLKNSYEGDLMKIIFDACGDIQTIINMKIDKNFKQYLSKLNEIVQNCVNIFNNQFDLLEKNSKMQRDSSSQNMKQVEDDQLDIILDRIYEQEKISEVNYQILMEDELNIIKKIVSELNLESIMGLKNVYVQPFGSLVSGFSQNTSDIDISINTNCYLDERIFLTLIHSFMKNYFATNSIKYKELELIDVARIPLIHLVKYNEKLEGEDKSISIDICINNVLGCTNSQMLKIISQTHPLIPKLGLIIKKWAKTQEIISKKNLTSYSIILIVIRFLQRKGYIDSNLHFLIQQRQADQKYKTKIKRKKEIDEDFETSLYYIQKSSVLQKSLNNYKSVNPNKKTILDINLSTLFVEFINYYSDQTDSAKRYINIIDDYIIQNYDSSLYFFIIDPFDVAHNPGERSKVTNINDNIYINAFKSTQQELQMKNYEQIFINKLSQR